jgi:hypothetical protein
MAVTGHHWWRQSRQSSFDEEDDLTGDPVGDDLIVLHHTFYLLHSEGHDPTQRLGSFRDGGTTRIVETNF